MSKKDLEQYAALWKSPVVSPSMGGVTVQAPPPPGGGPLLAFMLATMDMFRPSRGDLMPDNSLTYHRLVETFKFAQPFREDLGDDQFEDVEDVRRTDVDHRYTIVSGWTPWPLLHPTLLSQTCCHGEL